MIKHSACVLLLTAGASVALADDTWPVPAGVTLARSGYAGTGCPAGDDARVEFVDPGQIVVDFAAMSAVTGDGVPFPERRKACSYYIDLRYPAGWTYAVDAVFGRGFADIAVGTQGEIVFSSYFQGEAATPSVTRPVTGPARGVENVFEVFAGSWAPCVDQGDDNFRSLIFKGEVRLSGAASGARARLALAGPVHVYLKWRRCAAE